MRDAWIVLLPSVLSGCFVPPSVAVASYAVDAGSYAATGKSVEDHGLSAVKNQDCATWHFFVGRAVCEDPKHPVPAAPLEARNGRPAALATAAPSPQSDAPPPPATIQSAAAPDAALPVAAPSPPAPEPEPAVAIVSDEHYFSVGTFSDRRRAELYARRFADYNPRLVPAIFAGRELIRVVLGPLDLNQMARLREHSIGGMVVERPVSDLPAVATSPVPMMTTPAPAAPAQVVPVSTVPVSTVQRVSS
jgi:hypothetical protein